MEAIKIIPERKQIDWEYDEEADVLYLSFGKPRSSIGIDMGEGLIVRYDENRGEVTGLTVIGVRTAVIEALQQKGKRKKRMAQRRQ